MNAASALTLARSSKSSIATSSGSKTPPNARGGDCAAQPLAPAAGTGPLRDEITPKTSS